MVAAVDDVSPGLRQGSQCCMRQNTSSSPKLPKCGFRKIFCKGRGDIAKVAPASSKSKAMSRSVCRVMASVDENDIM